MKTTIWFDMDGTIADLYGVDGWLPMLQANDPAPYVLAKPLVRLSTLAYMLNRLQKQGYRIGVISWLAKNATPEYNMAVTGAKQAWLAQHLPSVHWDEINIVPYGFGKWHFAQTPHDVLFDDEARNRIDWTGNAYDVDNIIEVLKSLG